MAEAGTGVGMGVVDETGERTFMAANKSTGGAAADEVWGAIAGLD